jgi:hypothetical protein
VQQLATDLRPAVQAVVEVAVAGARVALLSRGDEDQVWAATVINVADTLGLDLTHEGQTAAAVAVTELVMQQAGYGH